MLGSILRSTADEADPDAIEVTVEDDPTDPDPDAEAAELDVGQIDDLDGLKADIDRSVNALLDLHERATEEQRRRDRDERLDPFDIPAGWTRDASAYGESYIEAVIRAYNHLRDRGEATTEAVYQIYRRTVPHGAISRKRFGLEFAPVLSGADGIEARLYRLDPDEALTGDAIDAAAREPTYRFIYGPEVVAAAYRALADAPEHGLTRLALASAARRRSNVALPPKFIGPDDPDDLADGQAIEDFEFLGALLSMPGVEPPAEPAWRYVGGEADE